MSQDELNALWLETAKSCERALRELTPQIDCLSEIIRDPSTPTEQLREMTEALGNLCALKDRLADEMLSTITNARTCAQIETCNFISGVGSAHTRPTAH